MASSSTPLPLERLSQLRAPSWQSLEARERPEVALGVVVEGVLVAQDLVLRIGVVEDLRRERVVDELLVLRPDAHPEPPPSIAAASRSTPPSISSTATSSRGEISIAPPFWPTIRPSSRARTTIRWTSSTSHRGAGLGVAGEVDRRPHPEAADLADDLVLFERPHQRQHLLADLARPLDQALALVDPDRGQGGDGRRRRGRRRCGRRGRPRARPRCPRGRSPPRPACSRRSGPWPS